MLNFETLGSSSKGNCYLIKTSNEILILECGMHYKKILQALNFDLSKVAGCLISHEHQDHSKAVNDIVSAGINVYTSLGTLEALSVKGHRAYMIESKKQFQLGGFSILPFEVQHDAAEPLGFLIYHHEFGRMLFATDTFYVKYKFPELNYVAIECNYSGEILNDNIRDEKTSSFLKRRLLSSHFSLENVKKFFLANDLSKLKEIKLLHLSDANSNAKQFKSEIERLTGVPVSVC